jgi:hypothetical protein
MKINTRRSIYQCWGAFGVTPKGIISGGEHLELLAPTKDMIDSWNCGHMSEESYVALYMRHLIQNRDSITAWIRELEESGMYPFGITLVGDPENSPYPELRTIAADWLVKNIEFCNYGEIH